MQQHLAHFKTRGQVDFSKVLSVPTSQRIGALTAYYGRQNMAETLAAVIGRGINTMNLRHSMSGYQLAELADALLDEATEDNLAMEDVLLFLQNLVRGKMGKIYDRMDMQVFLELFESYREDRFQAIRHIRYEQEVNRKSWGATDRSCSREADPDRTAIKEYLRTNAGRNADNQGSAEDPGHAGL